MGTPSGITALFPSAANAADPHPPGDGGAAAEAPFGEWPDTYLGRVEALAVMQTLNADLLASRSATFTLEKWCADHRLARDPTVRAHLRRDVAKPATPAQRQRLQVDEGETLKYRRVLLACDGRVFSEADNWYVPGRLTAEMNRLLDETDTAFGYAVHELNPYRRTFSVDILWHPLAEGWEMRPLPEQAPAGGTVGLPIPPYLFEHSALIHVGGQPISEVREIYSREVLGFSRNR